MGLTIEDAEREMHSLESKIRELDKLKERHALLRNFVELGQRLSANGNTIPVPEPALFGQNVPASSSTMGIAAAALRESEPLSTRDLVERMKMKGWRGSGSDAKDYKAVYVSLYRKKEMFEKLGDGTWKLRPH